MSESKTPTLTQKILKAVKKVQSIDITKDGTNDYSNYDYVSEVQMSQLGHYLADYGVIFMPKIVPVEHWTETNKRGALKNYVLVQGKFTLTDGTDSITGSMPGIGTDATDKAIYKAETGAKKNFLMQFFLVASKDDPDNQKKQNQNGSKKRNYNSKSSQDAMKRKPVSNGQIRFLHKLISEIDTGRINNQQTKAYAWVSKNDFTNSNMWVASSAINILEKAPKKIKA